MVAAIALWFRLRLPYCGPGFEYQVLHLRFFQFVIDLWCEKDKNKNGKEDGIGPYFKQYSLNSQCKDLIALKQLFKCRKRIFSTSSQWHSVKLGFHHHCRWLNLNFCCQKQPLSQVWDSLRVSEEFRKNSWWMDWNYGPSVSEVTALPTALWPVYKVFSSNVIFSAIFICIESLLMTGFEPCTFNVRSNCSANSAALTRL